MRWLELSEFSPQRHTSHQRVADIRGNLAVTCRAYRRVIMMVQGIMHPSNEIPASVFEFNAGMHIEQAVRMDEGIDTVIGGTALIRPLSRCASAWWDRIHPGCRDTTEPVSPHPSRRCDSLYLLSIYYICTIGLDLRVLGVRRPVLYFQPREGRRYDEVIMSAAGTGTIFISLPNSSETGLSVFWHVHEGSYLRSHIAGLQL